MQKIASYIAVRFLSSLFVLMIVAVTGFGQCVNGISTFPFVEDFENNNGNWVVGGNVPDWAWGTPAKPVINRAGSGNKCWITGGLTNSSYSNGQNSWLQSPCFNLSSLTNPIVTFKVFWETERRYDGASLQYSTNNGNTWQVLGGINSNADCSGVNWFNTNSITTLNNAGWSGNIQATSPCTGGAGSGSGTWLTATHNLAAVAGQSGVLFRFTFAAGTQCNAYDGFAIDSFSISEAPQPTTSFSYSCAGNSTVNFTSNVSPCAQSYNWDFGDPASGANNFSSAVNPSHNFSAPGNYTIKLQVAYAGNVLVTTQQNITVLLTNITITDSIKCNGAATGALLVTVSGGNGNYQYTWNNNASLNTASIQSLTAGMYGVTVTAANACTVRDSILLTQPNAIAIVPTIQPVVCSQKGSINVTVTGGKSPYQYLWSNGANSASLNNLNAGQYRLTITDANGCTQQSNALVVDSTFNSFQINLGRDTAFCSGNLVLNPGSFNSYKWQDNSTSSSYTVNQSGKYWVTVNDANGCTAKDTINVTVDCSGIYFPSAFTPNNDFKNDGFGPLGNLAALSNYQLRVFNRWGQEVFFSNNPYAQWNGKTKGLNADIGVYVWMASFSLNNQPIESRKGTVTLIR